MVCLRFAQEEGKVAMNRAGFCGQFLKPVNNRFWHIFLKCNWRIDVQWNGKSVSLLCHLEWDVDKDHMKLIFL